jgi:Autophagy protein Atg8 ubiquitin like
MTRIPLSRTGERGTPLVSWGGIQTTPSPSRKHAVFSYRALGQKSDALAMPTSFKAEFPLDKRQAESTRIRSKYTDRVPVIVERAERRCGTGGSGHGTAVPVTVTHLLGAPL